MESGNTNDQPKKTSYGKQMLIIIVITGIFANIQNNISSNSLSPFLAFLFTIFQIILDLSILYIAITWVIDFIQQGSKTGILEDKIKHLNIKQDTKEVLALIRDLTKRYPLFSKTIKSFFIVLKWLFLIVIIVYGFKYFLHSQKISWVIKHREISSTLNQELQKCVSEYSLPAENCTINEFTHPNLYLFSNDELKKTSDKELDEYGKQLEQYKNELSKQLAICQNRSSLIKENRVEERNAIINKLSYVLNSYINVVQNYPDDGHGLLPDNYYNLILPKETFSRIPEMKNKCTISELQQILYNYQSKLTNSTK